MGKKHTRQSGGQLGQSDEIDRSSNAWHKLEGNQLFVYNWSHQFLEVLSEPRYHFVEILIKRYLIDFDCKRGVRYVEQKVCRDNLVPDHESSFNDVVDVVVLFKLDRHLRDVASGVLIDSDDCVTKFVGDSDKTVFAISDSSKVKNDSVLHGVRPFDWRVK
ncbi:uncharacterized protein VTP21DRAFT_5935 [Calcarisporiella thermophila]|uniref:uncharacterized protein n=1 Tax=Calcarisporiella thermophila TaxID=911321 RepID=UPI0037447A5B